jgi:hypothetical protein
MAYESTAWPINANHIDANLQVFCYVTEECCIDAAAAQPLGGVTKAS